MRLVSADWVLPVCARRRFATAPCWSTATASSQSAHARELEAAASADVEREHFAGCTITPGLVNAHTHLTLTALSGVVPPAPFPEWLPRLVAAMKPWDIADHEASGVVGAEESLASGVTVVGDIAYGAAEVASASRAGLGGVYYWELLGMPAEQLAEQLEYLRFPRTRPRTARASSSGLSPHSPYTCGPGAPAGRAPTGRRTSGYRSRSTSPSPPPRAELLMDGTGPLAGVADATRSASWPRAPRPSRISRSRGARRGRPRCTAATSAPTTSRCWPRTRAAS